VCHAYLSGVVFPWVMEGNERIFRIILRREAVGGFRMWRAIRQGDGGGGDGVDGCGGF
jgi:hypothetical protein